ncbi:MAG: DUF6159 family protein [Thermoleophilaceae bacterium]
MSRFRLGWALSGDCWRTLRSNRGLVLFPLYGAVALLVVVAPLAGPGAWLADRGDSVPGVALIAAGIYAAAFITTFFGVALAAAADRALRGKPGGLGYGFGVARTRLRAIAGWALLTATVSLVIRALESRGEIAQIIGRLFGGAWSLVTFLALPVVAEEGLGPIAALKRSAGLFRERWGGQLGGMASIGIKVLVFGTLPSIGLVVAGVAILSGSGSAGLGAGAILVALGVAGFGISMLVGSALRQVFAVALYRYAVDGQALGGFSTEALDSSVARRS